MSDEITQTTDVTDTAGEVSSTENKEPALVPSFRLREETEKREKAEAKNAEYEAKFAETDAQIQQAKLDAERTYAKEVYGDYVEDPAVQEYKTKYPDLSYKQIFGALEIEVPTNHWSYTGNPWRPAWSLSWDNWSSEYTVSQLSDLMANNPSEYKRVMAEYAGGKVTVKAW